MHALQYLNSRTPHRFTGIFRFDGDALTNTHLFDREARNAPLWNPFPASDSFCSVIHDTGKSFTVADSSRDTRVEAHSARERVAAYCGVPLILPGGPVYGSLCHFDYRPIVFTDLDLALLQVFGPELLETLIL